MSKIPVLSQEQLEELLARFSPDALVVVTRIRYKNRVEIRRSSEMTVEALREFVLTAMEKGHQPGGDLEVFLPGMSACLVGHHDGIYWLEQQELV